MNRCWMNNDTHQKSLVSRYPSPWGSAWVDPRLPFRAALSFLGIMDIANDLRDESA